MRKVNEIPDKIHLSYEFDDEDDKDHIFIDYMWHRHPFEGKNLKNVEYTRTDAFIEKAEKYLENQFTKDVSVLAGGIVSINFNIAIRNFINYMKGE